MTWLLVPTSAGTPSLSSSALLSSYNNYTILNQGTYACLDGGGRLQRCREPGVAGSPGIGDVLGHHRFPVFRRNRCGRRSPLAALSPRQTRRPAATAGQCLDIQYGSASNGQTVDMYPCNGGQSWGVTLPAAAASAPAPSSFAYVVSASASTYCLDNGARARWGARASTQRGPELRPPARQAKPPTTTATRRHRFGPATAAPPRTGGLRYSRRRWLARCRPRFLTYLRTRRRATA